MTLMELMESGREWYKGELDKQTVWVDAQYMEQFRRHNKDLRVLSQHKYAIASCCHRDNGNNCENVLAIQLRAVDLDMGKAIDFLSTLREPLFGTCLERIGERLASPSRLIASDEQLKELEQWSVDNVGRCFCPEHSHS